MTYEYRCQDCGDTTAVQATLAEKERGLRPACTTCGGQALRRLFSTVASVGAGTVPAGSSGGGGCCGGGCGCG